MTFSDFVNQYWTVICGIASFIFALGYAKAQVSTFTKDMAIKEKNMQDKISEQKKDHDEKIAILQVQVTEIKTRLEDYKDKTFDAISAIQADVKAIIAMLNNKVT